jgi:hypothetical protein
MAVSSHCHGLELAFEYLNVRISLGYLKISSYDRYMKPTAPKPWTCFNGIFISLKKPDVVIHDAPNHEQLAIQAPLKLPSTIPIRLADEA